MPESARRPERLPGLPTVMGTCSQGKCKRCYLPKKCNHSPCVRKLHGIFVMFKKDGGGQVRITVTCFGKNVPMVELNTDCQWWVYLLLNERQGKRKNP